jgi:hypothetical protein
MLHFAALCFLPFSVLGLMPPSAFYRILPSENLSCPQPSFSAFSRILLYAAICSFLPSETFCLVPFPSFCCS